MYFISASMRHSFKFTDAVYYTNRSVLDEESNLDHLYHALTSLAMAVAIIDKHKGK